MIRENHVYFNPEDEIIVTTGATEALMLTMLTLINPGDEVIIPDPAWPDYLGQVLMSHATPVFAKLHEENQFKMTADVIRPLLTNKTKLIVLNSPANPTGAMLDHSDLAEIAKMIEERGIYAISDEPYERLVYDDNRHVSLASFEGMKNYVITINSFSKTYAMTGWRMGYACTNAFMIEKMVKLHENITSCLSEAFQLAGAYALDFGDESIKIMRNGYLENRNLLVDALNSMNGFRCHTPPATFYAFPNIKGLNLNSQAAANLILDKCHVVTSPGGAFGESGEGFIRICFATSKENLAEAVMRMKNYFG